MHFPLLPRHPELVSGSISRFDRSQRRQAQPHREVGPVRVRLVDQVYLPRPMPVLELFLARDRADHVAEHLEMNQSVCFVARGKSWCRAVTVLPKSGDEIRGYANVQRAVMAAGENVDAGIAFLRHGPERAAKWTLKQVQGDEEGLDLEKSPDFRSNSQARPRLQTRHPEFGSGYIGPQTRNVR